MIKRHCIEAALALPGDNRALAAELLGLSRQSLFVKLWRNGLSDSATEGEQAKMSSTPWSTAVTVRRDHVMPETADTDGRPGDADYIDLDDAPIPVGELVDRAVAGDGVLILRAGRPVAQLLPVRRQPGGWEGKVRIGEDFDDPLPKEILDAFESSATTASLPDTTCRC